MLTESVSVGDTAKSGLRGEASDPPSGLKASEMRSSRNSLNTPPPSMPASCWPCLLIIVIWTFLLSFLPSLFNCSIESSYRWSRRISACSLPVNSHSSSVSIALIMACRNARLSSCVRALSAITKLLNILTRRSKGRACGIAVKTRAILGSLKVEASASFSSSAAVGS